MPDVRRRAGASRPGRPHTGFSRTSVPAHTRIVPRLSGLPDSKTVTGRWGSSWHLARSGCGRDWTRNSLGWWTGRWPRWIPRCWTGCDLGLYQLRQTRIPEHAAVHETVEGVRTDLGPGAAGLANAVLRRAVPGGCARGCVSSAGPTAGGVALHLGVAPGMAGATLAATLAACRRGTARGE